MKMLADGLVEVVKGYVAGVKESLSGRIDAIERTIAELPSPRAGEPGKDGVDGKDATPLDEGVVIENILARIPIPSNGKDGAPGIDGKDGKDGSSFTIDDAKNLLDGHLARWELDFERRANETLQRAIDRLEKPKDGINGADGKDGLDGLGFDDMTIEHDGERGFCMTFAAGEKTKRFEFTIPVVIDRGFYKEGESFEKGDGVTFGGSYWISQAVTRSKPEIGNPDWRLAVKKGRDAKNSVEVGKK
ncbi:hypothetical protein [Schauerella aestuarii]|uniref:hypothetical protein n=1 Tax=Schauerella aestuarii TaxID=2511204 RepID=UPI00136E38BB|nr:hypothetical protein [Achromobacter aestuarii]MYZ41413.1 hypothetical protein [Achromobacter aestuarii]